MTNEMSIMKEKENELSIWEDNVTLEEIKKIFGKGLSDGEFQIFVQLGRAMDLNPFKRELWAVKYGDNAAQIFVARDGYRKGISRTPNYEYHVADAVYSNDKFSRNTSDGGVIHEYSLKDRGRVVGAYCLVYMKTSSRPYYVWVDIAEYDKGQSLWKSMKATMIKKVAECQCIRMACTAFNGTYAPDEMEEDTTIIKNAQKSSSVIIDHSTSIDEESNEIIFTFSEVKSMMNKATSMDDLGEAASVVNELTIDSEQKKELSDIYRAKRSELKSSNGEQNG